MQWHVGVEDLVPAPAGLPGQTRAGHRVQAEQVLHSSSPRFQQVSLWKEAPPTAYLAIKEANNMLILRAGVWAGRRTDKQTSGGLVTGGNMR